jgi:uncharacterized protein YjbI with pentapeptide repeats
MANPEHLALRRREGVDGWNRWRNMHAEITPDLSEADLRRMNFNVANLRFANLKGADLRWATLERTDLTGADLREADLSRADMSQANLADADLSGADLTEAKINEAGLGNTCLADAMVEGTFFGNNDLSTTKGLETVHHFGPSVLGSRPSTAPRATFLKSFCAAAACPTTSSLT